MVEEKNGNYFLMPKAVFHLDLCPGELAVYSYLRNCINQDYECWPSYNTIGNAVGMSKKTVKRYVDSLSEKGFITAGSTSRFTKDGLKLNGNLKYNIRPIAEAEQKFYERQMSELEAAAERQKIAQLLENLQNAGNVSCQVEAGG